MSPRRIDDNDHLSSYHHWWPVGKSQYWTDAEGGDCNGSMPKGCSDAKIQSVFNRIRYRSQIRYPSPTLCIFPGRSRRTYTRLTDEGVLTPAITKSLELRYKPWTCYIGEAAACARALSVAMMSCARLMVSRSGCTTTRDPRTMKLANDGIYVHAEHEHVKVVVIR
jgi:hypothetical protein